MRRLLFALCLVASSHASAGPVPVIELDDGMTSVPLNRDATLPAVALMDGRQLVGIVHRVKADKKSGPRLALIDGGGNARVEMGRVTRADGVLLVSAGVVFYDEDKSPRLALEAGRLFRVDGESAPELVAQAKRLTVEDVKGRARVASDAQCTWLMDEKGEEHARICVDADGGFIKVGAIEVSSSTHEDDVLGAGAVPSGLRFVDRKGRATALPGVPFKCSQLAVPGVGTIQFKERKVKDGLVERLLP